MSVFYKCGIYGYQDSLYAYSMRQFYRECTIKGTVDIIFGNAIAVFQNCTILAKKGLPKHSNAITAQGGKFGGQSTGFSFQFCNISADFDLLPSIKFISTFLGRPWKPYSTTVFMESYIGNLLNPKGWLAWNGSQYLDTLFYAEYKNFGPGATTKNRVKWK
ncbi:pectinesterase/pectinesterase inhibitor PPE8B, partial [Trifolium medium]|nr:pectinesterase/pectinesterase inhibitor PPE8B [Trifolium medium]